MERKVVITLDADPAYSPDEIDYLVRHALNSIEQHEGISNPHVEHVSGDDEPTEEAEALRELLSTLERGDSNFEEKVEQAQEMAWRMSKDEEVFGDEE